MAPSAALHWRFHLSDLRIRQRIQSSRSAVSNGEGHAELFHPQPAADRGARQPPYGARILFESDKPLGRSSSAHRLRCYERLVPDPDLHFLCPFQQLRDVLDPDAGPAWHRHLTAFHFDRRIEPVRVPQSPFCIPDTDRCPAHKKRSATCTRSRIRPKCA